MRAHLLSPTARACLAAPTATRACPSHHRPFVFLCLLWLIARPAAIRRRDRPPCLSLSLSVPIPSSFYHLTNNSVIFNFLPIHHCDFERGGKAVPAFARQLLQRRFQMITAIFKRCLNLILPYVPSAKTGVHGAHSRLGTCFYFIAKQSIRLISTVSPPPPPPGGRLKWCSLFFVFCPFQHGSPCWSCPC